jgi:Zn-dependent protease
MDEADEKQRKAMLAFQAASIVTSTISGAIMAYTGAASNEGLNGIPVVGPAIAQATGITNMIAVIASGAAQLANLRSKGNSDSATLSGVSAAVATNTLTTPTQYSSAIEGANIEESITDTKVYVVESDIQ